MIEQNPPTEPASDGAGHRTRVDLMSIEQTPEGLQLLADPSQEVLIERRPAFSQLAPVPLRHLQAQLIAAGEPHLPQDQHRQD